MAFPGDYNWRLDITSDSTQVDSSETDFPYYFDLSNITSADFWSNVQSDGGDLRVSTNSDGTGQLPLEVVSIDTTGETGEIHFKDSTDSASDKTFYLWWDDSTGTVSQPAVTNTYGRNAVWNKYLAVYHLGESSGNYIDSTGANDATQSNVIRGVSATIGEGVEFTGTQGEEIDTGITQDFQNNDWTLSSWVNADTISYGGSIGIIGGRWGSGNQSSFTYGFDTSNNWVVYLFDGSLHSITSPASTNETYLAVTWDSSNTTGELFENGVSVGTNSNSGTLISSTDNLVIGLLNDDVNSGNVIDGVLDEVRVSLNNLGSGWLSTEYSMQSANGSFWTTGAPQEVGTEGARRPLSFGAGL